MPGAISNDAATPAPAERVCGIYHITHPRSASNLFQNMMGRQPGFQYSSYKLFGAGFGALTQLQRGPLGEWPKEDRERLFGLFEAGFEGMQEEVEGAVRSVSFNFPVSLLLIFLGGDRRKRKRKERESVLGWSPRAICMVGVFTSDSVYNGGSCESQPRDCVLPLGSHDKASDLLIELIPTDIEIV